MEPSVPRSQDLQEVGTVVPILQMENNQSLEKLP